MKNALFVAVMALLMAACTQGGNVKTLPILGERSISAAGDTLYPRIRDFRFVDQDSQIVTNATFDGKVYVVDFFFIHCPTICPKVKAQAKRIYDKYVDDPRVILLAHSIDTRNDTVAALKRYANKLDIRTEKWHLVTGAKDSIETIADDYFSVAFENPDAPGGYEHSGRLILIDKNRHVRSFCDGTDPKDVSRFMEDIDLLLAEQFPAGGQ
jgi:protein SCO1